jgi:hypothetical protein
MIDDTATAGRDLHCSVPIVCRIGLRAAGWAVARPRPTAMARGRMNWRAYGALTAVRVGRDPGGRKTRPTYF